MRRSASILLALLFLGGTLAEDFRCLQEEMHKLAYGNSSVPIAILTPADPANRETRDADGEAPQQDGGGDDGFERIRIRFYWDDLKDPRNYCTRENQKRHNFLGEEVVCTEEDILTDEKKQIMEDFIIPSAIELHSKRLRVKPVTGNVSIPSDTSDICRKFSIPDEHYKRGVTGADLYVYLAARPMGNFNACAWETDCARLPDGRVVAAAVEFDPRYIAKTRTAVRAMVHELLHALGFAYSTLQSLGMITRVNGVRGRSFIPVIATPKVMEHAGKHFDCNTFKGMEMSTSGNDYSHWHRRNLKDDIMATSGGTGVYSAITMAVLEDTGFYKVDYEQADRMTWGHGQGCRVLNQKCVRRGVSQQPSMWCTSKDPYQFYCPSGHEAIGFCNIEEIGKVSRHFKYFESGYWGSPERDNMDYCPFVVPHALRGCSDGEQSKMPGSLISESSRCFASGLGMKGLFLKGRDVPVGAICAKVTCDKVSRSYTLRLSGAESDVGCVPGHTITPSEYSDVFVSGTIKCPPYHDICWFQEV